MLSKKTNEKEFVDFLDAVLSPSRELGKIYFLEGVDIGYCSGWYVPRFDFVVVFSHDGHRRFVKDLKAIAGARKASCEGLFECEWVRFNINPSGASITANGDKYGEVMDLLNRLKPYLKCDMEVEFAGGNVAMFKPDDIDTTEDLIKRFWVCKMKF